MPNTWCEQKRVISVSMGLFKRQKELLEKWREADVISSKSSHVRNYLDFYNMYFLGLLKITETQKRIDEFIRVPKEKPKPRKDYLERNGIKVIRRLEY